MILNTIIEQVAAAQYKALSLKNKGLPRKAMDDLPALSYHALIISDIRLCGKSTLLCQLQNSKYPDAFFLNFEDPRLYDFERNDFTRLDREIKGLFEAPDYFNLTEGSVVTLQQTDCITRNNKMIRIVPAHIFLTATNGY
jgi:hypothetical protein